MNALCEFFLNTFLIPRYIPSMQRTFKYKIYPNIEQRKALFNIFDFCRFLYNSALEERINFYKLTKSSKNYAAQSAALPEIKTMFPSETSLIYSQTLQQTLKQVDIAYKNFFRRVKEKASKAGFPRFKNSDRFRSILFPQVKPDLSGGCIKLISNKIRIYGVGEVKIKYHRPIQGIAKQCRIVKQNDNFYLCIICDKVSINPLPKTGKTVGIDLGLNSFVTMDDGTKFHHPKPYKTSLEKLQYRQRKLALKQRGSNNRNKQKKLVVKTYEKITNQREDYQHKLANKIVREYDKIIIEKLNVKNMLEAKGGLQSKPLSSALRNKGFEVSKSNIQDASWSKFIEKLTYKAESADKLLLKVDPRNTSKMCSQCGKVKEKLTLRDRIFNCETCGLAIDRDINAAKNIRALGTSAAIRNDFRSQRLVAGSSQN